MTTISHRFARLLNRLGSGYLPFADVATPDLPLGRLLRLSLFQVTVGMAAVLLTGTLNRVMIVELGVPAWLVAAMVSLPLLFAPLRALIGHRSDNYISALGWRRVPFIWFGSMLQFGGLAFMPFALLVLTGEGHGPAVYGQIGAALAFLLVGAGMHTTQTAGLALATDLAAPESRPRVVALLYVMLLFGMFGSALAFGFLLNDYTHLKLVQVIQGAALLTMGINVYALWKQEARNPAATKADRVRPDFRSSWRELANAGRTRRLLVAVGLGTAGFSMQDILLEPYGGQILGLSVSATTALTALFAGGTLIAFALAGRRLGRGDDPNRLAAVGALFGIAGFSAIIFSDPLASPLLFRIGTAAIGFGGGFFAVGTLTAAMDIADCGQDGRLNGLALGAWGAVQATAAGLAVGIGGALRDIVSELAMAGYLGEALARQSTGYVFVYHVEIALLFVTLIAIGPIVRVKIARPQQSATRFGLAEFPN
ncbi:MAG: BCD family MFS transporter [Pseudomonadota bacterium]